MIRYLTLAKPDEDWLDDAEDEFEDALDEQPESSAAIISWESPTRRLTSSARPGTCSSRSSS